MGLYAVMSFTSDPFTIYAPESILATGVLSVVSSMGFLLLYFDKITRELRKNEQSLMNAKTAAEIANQYKTEFLAHMSDAMILVDPNQRIQGTNRATKKLFGYEEEEILAMPIVDFIKRNVPHDHQPEATPVLEKILKSDTFQALELNVCSKEGQKIPVVVTKTKLIDPKGGLISFIYVFSNQSEKKQAEENLALLQKMMETDQLKNNIITWAAHELKTPLTPIYGIAQLLRSAKTKEKDLNQEFELKDFQMLERNIDRLLKILDNFLDVGRLQSGNFLLNLTDVEISEVIGDSVKFAESQAAKKNIKFIIEQIPAQVKGDKERLEQVLLNLLTNAIKYSPENSMVKIEVTRKDETTPPRVSIKVIDQGYGFTGDEIIHADQPFAKIYTQQDQKKYIAGTGVGLFISKSIIASHGGELRISSPGPDKGSTIEVLLPTT